MNKKIFSIIMAAVMVCSAIYAAAVPETASAASEKVYMTTQADDFGSAATLREKFGDYYIWVDSKAAKGTYSSSLKCAKSLKKGKAKTLKKVNSKTKFVVSPVVTDGKTIYYGVLDSKTGKGTIYKTTTKGNAHKKVKTVKNFVGVAAFYGGKIYYNAYEISDHGESDALTHLYSYDMAKKKTRLEKKEYAVGSGYGRYMSGGGLPTDVSNYMHELYDAKTGKSSSPVKCYNMVIWGKTVYYTTVTYDFDNQRDLFTLKKCNLSGKNKKTVKTPKNMSLVYLGRKAAYFEDRNTGKTKKLTYRTKKFTTVK